MTRLVHSLAASGRFDYLYVKRIQMAQHAADVAGVPRLLDFTDSMALYHQRMLELAGGPSSGLAWLVHRLEAQRMARYEPAVARAWPLSVISSPVDRDFLLARAPDVPPGKITVIPNCVDTDYFHPRHLGPLHRTSEQRTSDTGHPTLAFWGNLSYAPNVDGVLHFARAVLPAIRHAVPRARLLAVGARPHRRLRPLAGAGVQFTGYVDDVRQHLAEAAVFVNPVRGGAGTRNKLLEAMALGLPVVTTRAGAEGVAAEHGVHALIAADDAAFAAHVVELLRCPSLASDLALAARQLVEERYSLHRIGRQLDDLLVGTVADTPDTRVRA